MNQGNSGAVETAVRNQAASPAQTGGNSNQGTPPRKAKKQLVVSPFAPAKFSYLNRPDTRFDPGKGKYSVHLVMDPHNELHSSFLSDIAMTAMVAAGETASFPIYEDKDRHGNYAGKQLMKFASSYPPKLLDMSKRPLSPDTIIGNGSVIRVAALVNVYKNLGGRSGINLYLKSVQVKELSDPFTSDGDEFPDEPVDPAGAVAPAEASTPATEAEQSVTGDEIPF
jgi:hypothetical protein